MNMTPLDELTKGVPKTSNSYQPVYRALQGSLVARQFQALGYRYLHLGSWWNPTRTDATADRNYNADGVSDFAAAVVEESLVPILSEKFLPKELPPTESAKHLKHNSWALNVLDGLPRESGPKFVFAHILLPHPPYVFDRDGRYIPPAEAVRIPEVDAWHRQLDYTNSRLRAFIASLLAKPEAEQPIIILQADEGPWPEKYGKDKYNFNWATATDREAPDEVRDPERLVRPGRGGCAGPPPGPDRDQHVPGPVRRLLRARLPEAAGPVVRLELGPAVPLDRDHRPVDRGALSRRELAGHNKAPKGTSITSCSIQCKHRLDP